MRPLSTVCCLMLLLLPMNTNANQTDLKIARRDFRLQRDIPLRGGDGVYSKAPVAKRVRSKSKASAFRAKAAPLPLVILSKPATNTPAEAARSGKPIVFIMANIHAGEVEGKEATLHLMREIVTGQLSGLLDKIIAARCANIQRGRQREDKHQQPHRAEWPRRRRRHERERRGA